MRTGRPLLAWIVTASILGTGGCIFYLHPQCDDGVRNGSETDVDCGGGCAQKCDLDRSCSSGADCGTGYCESGRCLLQPCANGVRDGAETDVDCGGGTCRKCSGGRHCAADADCFSGRCDPARNVCFSLQTISFADGVSYLAGNKTYNLFSGDLNGDGIPDLVAMNEQEDSVTVLLGVGDGTFRRTAPNFPTGAYPVGGAIADFNRDGIPDVATADYHGDSVSILLGVGDGTLGPPAHYPTAPGASTQVIAVGDLYGDGYLDVVATNPGTGSVSLFRGRPDGTLGPSTNIPVGPVAGHPSSEPFSVAIADFDGDGKNDVAISDLASNTVVVRLGNGDGSLRPEVAFPEGGTGPSLCIARDVDLDGKVDLLCSNRGSDNVSVLLGRGDGTFGLPILSSTGVGTGPYSIAVADFNLDGVPDVVTPNFQTGTASVLLGVGDGRFEDPIQEGPLGVFTYGVATGDFNRDGRPDFAVCNATTNDVVVKLSTSR